MASTLYCHVNPDTGFISTETELPNKYGDIAGGFHTLTPEILATYNWFRYVRPIVDETLYTVGDLVFDSELNIVTNSVTESIQSSDEMSEIGDDKEANILEYCEQQLQFNISGLFTLDSADTDAITAEQTKINNVKNSMLTEFSALITIEDIEAYDISGRFDYWYALQ